MGIQGLKLADNSTKGTILSKFKMSFAILAMMVVGVSFSAKATDYNVDKSASTVKWDAKKVTGEHNGTISFANGSISATNGAISAGTLVIDMKSIVNTDLTDAGYNAKLIGHLTSDDFFGVEKFPTATLVVKKATLISGDDYKISGDLTIKGVTNPFEFTASVKQSGDKINAEGTMTINRAKFGVKYGSSSFFQGLGDKVIYDDFTLAFSIVGQKK